MRYRALVVALLTFCFSFWMLASDAFAASQKDLTYKDIFGTGLANNCPELDNTIRGSIPLEKGKSYRIVDMCLQPTAFFVKEEGGKRQKSNLMPGKVMTRKTSSLTFVEGALSTNSDGSLTFTEEDGMDFQPITVQLPGGERIPLLFTIKGLVAKTQPNMTSITTSTDFEGDFRVPSYRTSNFLDPKGRGLTTGYDNAVALPANADGEELLKENVKRFQLDKGHIALQIAQIDGSTGEFTGTFESEQPSETDMGSREASEVTIRGSFYGRLQEA